MQYYAMVRWNQTQLFPKHFWFKRWHILLDTFLSEHFCCSDAHDISWFLAMQAPASCSCLSPTAGTSCQSTKYQEKRWYKVIQKSPHPCLVGTRTNPIYSCDPKLSICFCEGSRSQKPQVPQTGNSFICKILQNGIAHSTWFENSAWMKTWIRIQQQKNCKKAWQAQ